MSLWICIIVNVFDRHRLSKDTTQNSVYHFDSASCNPHDTTETMSQREWCFFEPDHVSHVYQKKTTKKTCSRRYYIWVAAASAVVTHFCCQSWLERWNRKMWSELSFSTLNQKKKKKKLRIVPQVCYYLRFSVKCFSRNDAQVNGMCCAVKCFIMQLKKKKKKD